MAVLQQLLYSLLPFVVVLSVVVFVHEFGHFQAARLRKVAVDTFSIGFGKSLLSWRDRQGVLWKVGMLPLGGYVKFADDRDGISMGPTEELDPAAKAEARAKGMFHAQTLLTRGIVVAAGPFTNFVFAILAFAAIAMIMGRDVTDYNSFAPKILAVQPQTAGAAAGLQPGDLIVAVDNRPISTWAQFQAQVVAHGATPISLTLANNGATRIVSLTPRIEEHPDKSGTMVRGPYVGIALDQSTGPQVMARINPLEALGIGANRTWGLVSSTSAYLYGMVTGRNSGADIAGPLGILSASGQVAKASLAGHDNDLIGGAGSLVLSLLFFSAMLSVAVGFVNILPIPILDGGHLLMYIVEGIRGGRPLPPSAQEWAFRAGLAVMACLFLFATWNDISRWTQG